MGSVFAVGDIHGCLDKLVSLMDLIKVDFSRDTLVFIGDYIDRGPDSKEVIDYLIDLGRRQDDRVVFLRGNHEFMLQRYLKGEESQMFLSNGGEATLKSYMRNNPRDGSNPIPAEHIEFFENLRHSYSVGDYFFAHAGVKPRVPLEKQSDWDMMWIRDEFIYSDWDFGKKVVFGHTPFRQPLVMENKIGIDTGAVYGNKLTCVELPAERFFDV